MVRRGRWAQFDLWYLFFDLSSSTRMYKYAGCLRCVDESLVFRAFFIDDFFQKKTIVCKCRRDRRKSKKSRILKHELPRMPFFPEIRACVDFLEVSNEHYSKEGAERHHCIEIKDQLPEI